MAQKASYKYFYMLDYLGDQTKHKAVHELPVHNLDDVKTEVLRWIDVNTGILDDRTSTGFWMKIDYKSMARSCPSLIDYFRHVGVPVQEIVVGLLTEAMTSGFTLHHGSPGRNFKMNFPILNTEDVYTEWYDIPSADLATFPVQTNPHTGDSTYDLSAIHHKVAEMYPLRISYNMHTCPILFNSYLPHRVMPGPKAKCPRVMIATMPVNDPFDIMKR